MAKTGETFTGSVLFLSGFVVPLSFFRCRVRKIFFFIPRLLFTVHVRPVLSPCQAGVTSVFTIF